MGILKDRHYICGCIIVSFLCKTLEKDVDNVVADICTSAGNEDGDLTITRLMANQTDRKSVV